MDPILYELSRQRMIKLARILGTVALGIAVLMVSVSYLSLGLAALSLLIVILSKLPGHRLCAELKAAIVSSSIAITIAIFVFASVFIALKTNPEYRDNVARLVDYVYGESIGAETGESVEDLMDNIFGR